MALAATSSKANSSLSYSNISLVPLRVNVVSDDKNTTIVETMVLDRYCWPIPLYDPIEEAIDRNADELAHMLLTDLEVHGMGRTVRHFTGRVDFWSVSLQQKIKEQLLPQLQYVAKTTKLKIVKEFSKKRKSTNKNDSSEQQQGEGCVESKKQKTDENDHSQKTSEKEESRRAAEEEEAAARPTVVVVPPKKKHASKASLVPVRLRLCVNGVRIHDDFIWDLSVPQCPIEYAQSLAKDLQLSDEAAVAIVTSIVEQLDGSVVDDTKDLDGLTGSAAARKNGTAAWPLENRVHVSNMGQLLALHRST